MLRCARCSPKGPSMTDEELEQQDKQEEKEECQEERKKTLKTVITSVICTLLFVVILLLLVILCLKNCSPRPNNNDSSSSSEPEPTWTEYDNPKLTYVFKEIVNTYIEFNDVRKDLKDVMMVDYSDNKEETKFDLSICVTSNTEEKYVYYYEVENKSYAGFTDPITFLLDEHTDLFLDEVAHFETYKELNTTVSSDKPNRYIVVSNLANTAKYFFGSYQDATNYQFHIYDKVEFNDGDNPLTTNGKVVDTNNLLYGYYRSVYLSA